MCFARLFQIFEETNIIVRVWLNKALLLDRENWMNPNWVMVERS